MILIVIAYRSVPDTPIHVRYFKSRRIVLVVKKELRKPEREDNLQWMCSD